MMKHLEDTGGPGLTQYLIQGHTKLICCGHIHESVGVDKMKIEDEQVLVFNGGSLGDGYFGEIHIDDETKKIDKIELYQIKEKLLLPGDLKETMTADNITMLMKYFLTPEGKLKKMKVDFTDDFDY